jgi:hypothetical protein
VAVHLDRAFAPSAEIQESVARLFHVKHSAVERGSTGGLPRERPAPWIVDR